MKIHLACPVCEHPGTQTVNGPATWTCPGCGSLVNLAAPTVVAGQAGSVLQACVVCGSAELYKKKAFPHALGLSLLGLSFVAFLVLNYYRLQWWGWGILLGCALIDWVLYHFVPDVVVCYNCAAGHHGLGRSGNPPFELTIHERYRQMKLRQAELAARDKQPPAP